MEVWACHIPGAQNIADAISCNYRSVLFTGSRDPAQQDSSTEITAPGAAAKLDVSILGVVVQQLFSAGLAPASQNNYKSGTNRFLDFARPYTYLTPSP